MEKKYTIGVDIGTTNTKAVLYNKDYQVISYSRQSYPTICTEEGMAEQDPDQVFEAVIYVIQQILSEKPHLYNQIKFISFSSAMHSVIFLDNMNKPLSNNITWADNRAHYNVEQLKKTVNWLSLYKRTGTPIHSMTPFSKILWCKENRPSIFEKTRRIIGIKEYVLFKLTNDFKIDYSIASATGLLNIHELEWDEEILKILEVSKDNLSELVDVTYEWTKIDDYYSRKLGLPDDIKLVIGASDGGLSNLGLGAINPNEVAITIGTSGAVRMITDEIILDPIGRTFCYYLSKDKWLIGGAVNNGGNVIEWLSSVLYSNEETKSILIDMNKKAKNIAPGSDNLFFLPYINGERSPIWNSEIRGGFIGVSSYHSKGHFIKAAMEGVLFNLYNVWGLLQAIGGEAVILKATGGFLNSQLWTQMLADIFNETIYIPASLESSCLGAILIAEDNGLKLNDSKKITPNPETVKEYQKILPSYQQLNNSFVNMKNIQNG